MMNLLYEKFPESVNICGDEIEILTDFKDWIRFYDMLRDSDVNDAEKCRLIQACCISPVEQYKFEAVIDALVGFFAMREARSDLSTGFGDGADENDISEGRAKQPSFDFAFDAKYIISDFLSVYHIDLTRVHMHWWKFRILLDGLPADTEMKQRMMYRSTDIGQIKDPKERQRVQRIQRSIALPAPALTDYETGELFW